MGSAISNLLFRPPVPTPLKRSRHFWIPTKCSDTADGQGRIPAFFIKRRGAHLTLLFSHGNAEDLGMMYNRMKEIAMVFRVNVLAYDYCGYGKSSGSASERNCYWNIEAAYDFLVKVRQIAPEQIILYGRSLGSGPSCYLAAKTAQEKRPVAGLILHSPFLSVYRVVLDTKSTLLGDMFANVDNVPKVQCPVLIIHGTDDSIVPFWHAHDLLAAVPPEFRAYPFFAEGMGHNNVEVYMRDHYVATIKRFLDTYIPSRWGEVLPPAPIPVEDRAQVEVLSTNPCTVRINATWFGGSGATFVQNAVKRNRETEQVRRNVDEDELRDEVATVYREDDNRSLHTKMSNRSLQSTPTSQTGATNDDEGSLRSSLSTKSTGKDKLNKKSMKRLWRRQSNKMRSSC